MDDARPLESSGEIQVGGLTSEKLIERLKRALTKEGDFPASAKVVTELRMLTNDPNTTASQITEVILREPSLGTRILSLVNSSYYQRGKPIMTVSQAVMQIGMKPLAELCAGLVLLQKFIPTARKDSAFANCLRKLVITSLLSSSVCTQVSKAAGGKSTETGYLAGSLAEMGVLLLAYYFPKLYESAAKRAEQKHVDIGKAIQEITGLTPLQLSIEVVQALNLPTFYREILMNAENPQASTPMSMHPSERLEIANCAKGLYAARAISEVIAGGKSKGDADAALSSALAKCGLAPDTLKAVLGALPEVFERHCTSMELHLPALPDYVAAYAEPEDSEDVFKQFVEEIRQAVASGEPTASIITSVMETLSWSLKFDRVVLLLVNSQKTALTGRMFLGQAQNIDPKKIVRPVGAAADATAPDARAFRESRPIFYGNAIFPGGWPLAAIPIGLGPKAVGVIYADRSSGNKQELGSREQAAIGVLAELLNQSIAN
jgi:HD-like signal output (HDOD) protein